MLLAIKKEL